MLYRNTKVSMDLLLSNHFRFIVVSIALFAIACNTQYLYISPCVLLSLNYELYCRSACVCECVPLSIWRSWCFSIFTISVGWQSHLTCKILGKNCVILSTNVHIFFAVNRLRIQQTRVHKDPWSPLRIGATGYSKICEKRLFSSFDNSIWTFCSN